MRPRAPSKLSAGRSPPSRTRSYPPSFLFIPRLSPSSQVTSLQGQIITLQSGKNEIAQLATEMRGLSRHIGMMPQAPTPPANPVVQSPGPLLPQMNPTAMGNPNFLGSLLGSLIGSPNTTFPDKPKSKLYQTDFGGGVM